MSVIPNGGPATACGLRRFPKLSQIAGDLMDDLEASCHIQHFSAGQVVVEAGDAPDFVACVQSGYLRLQKTLADGRRHIVGLLVEGDLFGRVFDAPIQFTIEAATDAEVCCFQRRTFEDILLRSPELERSLMLNILSELDRARDWMTILSCHKITGRLAGFLLILCSRFRAVDHVVRVDGECLDVLVPISRPDLAHLLGTRRESVSRAFHALEDEGMIDILRPDLIRVRDVEGLAAEAGDEELAGRVALLQSTRNLSRKA
ncbi:Crp/Fnr family transcriptional regulator [Pseudooceanicola nanhaiensis]|uniref:Crp/Fnr family transcriptional regulator n=1 Tax=Pseudooceanicola nanhaiensis TaxID=375761 RepID=UPI001CD595A8|nr:Crp/Fnr family transcriptional regulator [Pseudooceanicola nanhaiensis]MCA0919307.1 Crp/Fnr family transcriptional regulator [Pseudooceanicola nanhaiensis]